MKSKKQYFYTYDGEVSGTVRQWLSECYGYSARLLTRIKEEGDVLLNESPCWLCDEVKKGDRLKVFLPKEDVNMFPVFSPLEILYEDDQVLVISKDRGTVTHPTKRHQEDTLGNYVAFHLTENEDHTKIRFVNRLDMDTTGVVVIAKNKYVHHYIQSGYGGKAEKTYMAFVHGVPKEKRGTISAPIKRVSPEEIIRCVDVSGQPCITHYEVVQDYGKAALLRIRLETGRTHQIRVHMQHMGHPIVGDPLYGLPDMPDFGMKRQALHASEMILYLPDRKRMHFRAPFKEDMMKLWKKLKKKDGEENG